MLGVLCILASIPASAGADQVPPVHPMLSLPDFVQDHTMVEALLSKLTPTDMAEDKIKRLLEKVAHLLDVNLDLDDIENLVDHVEIELVGLSNRLGASFDHTSHGGRQRRAHARAGADQDECKECH